MTVARGAGAAARPGLLLPRPGTVARGAGAAARLGLLLCLPLCVLHGALAGCDESAGNGTAPGDGGGPGAGGGGSGGTGSGGSGGTGFDACPTGTRRVAAGGSCAPVGWQQCPDGFARDPTGWGCLPVLPQAECPAGTRPAIGSATCVPVGPGPCAAGFAADPSGWGCAAILPEAPCPEGERQALGSTSCVKLGDCARPFPPADATFFVDAALAQEDATHLRSLAAAVAAAPAGAVIAIEAGVYAERLQLGRPVRLVGRCAGQVIVDGPAGTGTGILVSGASGVELEGLTVRGFDLGLEVVGGAAATLRELQVEQAGSSGLFVLDPGTTLTMERSVVRDLRGDAAGRFGQALTVGLGGALVLSRSELSGAQDQALYVLEGGSIAELTDVVIHDVRSRPAGQYGHGVSVVEDATATLTRVSIRDVAGAGVAVGGAQALAQLAGVEIRRVRPGLAAEGGEVAVGLNVEAGGRLAGTEVTVADAGILGAQANTGGSSLELEHTVLLRAGDPSRPFAAGIHAVGGRVVLRDVAVVEARGIGINVVRRGSVDAEGLLLLAGVAGPVRLAGAGIVADTEGAVLLRDVTVLQAHGAALYAAEPASSLEGSRVLVSGTLPGAIDSEQAYGVGVAVLEGAQLGLSESALLGSVAGGAICQGGAGLELTDSVVGGVDPTAAGKAGYGVVATLGCPLTITRGAILAATTAAAHADGQGSSLSFTEVSLAGIRPDAGGDRARGLNVQAGATATLERTAVAGARQVGLFAYGEGTSVVLRQSLIAGTTAASDGSFGNGIEAVFRAVVQLDGSELRGSAGVALLVAAAAASAKATSFSDNAVALHVQDGTTLTEGTVPPAPPPLELTVAPGCEFVENRARLGAGELPLVDPLEPLAQ